MTKTRDSDELLTLNSAADYIHELLGHRPNPATVFRWMKTGELSCFRIGRRVFTTRTALQKTLKSFNSPKPKRKSKNPPRTPLDET